MVSSNSEKTYTIAVVIPTYNNSKHIGRAVDSALAQTRPADEIIVVDDGSTDDTAEVVKRYGDKIKYIYQNNAGASAARNAGIEEAKSEWIAFLDGDDEWLPEILHKQVELLKRNKDLVWSTGNFIRCDCDNKHCQNPNLSKEKLKNVKAKLAGKEYFDNYFAIYLAGAMGCSDTMIIKKQILTEAGLFRPGQLRFNDEDMWFRIAYRWHRIGYLTEPLAIYHTGLSVLTTKYPALEIYCDLIERHLKIAKNSQIYDDARECMARLLKFWIHKAIQNYDSKGVRKAIKRFSHLLPLSFKLRMLFRSIFPKTTATAWKLVSRIKRI